MGKKQYSTKNYKNNSYNVTTSEDLREDEFYLKPSLNKEFTIIIIIIMKISF